MSGTLVLSACSSGPSTDSSSATTPEQTRACVVKANAFLADWKTFPTTLPQSPPARYTKLDQKPPTGKRAVYVRQNFPAAQSTSDGAHAAAEALGWNYQAVIYDNSVPDFIAKLDSVIATKPDFIMTNGLPAASFQKQIDDAKAAGITFVLTSVSDPPVSVPGLGGVGNATETAKVISRIHANMALSTSGRTAKTVIFSLDYPILDVSEDEYAKVMSEACPACTTEVVKIQPKDIGTPAATSQMVSKLEADPSTKYAYTMIGDIASGLAQALKPAGLDDVRIFGQVPNESSIAALRDGTNAWWVNQSSRINGYDMMDMAARISVTGRVQSDPGGYPLALLTKDNVPPGTAAPVIPENVLDLYEQTWGVGSTS
ncbi:substrate-binding domain-containing protein [Pseudonocardia kujensis]|uniref:sugar ABC transporter substrate-binding protein n=1 Tax=Pseudonocardia kujensis TaxID=1128675 RepID=UPI001E35C9CA|nr:substrate-binding domain-containing protein [Pseudonocardia kujensis]MCE0763549.1 substrate-binding domain-containing protein [Pseudonocardia kujensis]